MYRNINRLLNDATDTRGHSVYLDQVAMNAHDDVYVCRGDSGLSAHNKQLAHCTDDGTPVRRGGKLPPVARNIAQAVQRSNLVNRY